MRTSLAHKIALDPTSEQRQLFVQAAGVSRFTYNWALAEWQERYQLGGKPKGHLLKKSFNMTASGAISVDIWRAP